MTGTWQEAVRIAARWLRTGQPEGTALGYHGIRSPEVGGRYYVAIPVGGSGRPEIVVTVAKPRWDARFRCANGLAPRELAQVVELLASIGVDVAATSGGEGNDLGAIHLADPAHAALRKAAANRNGAPRGMLPPGWEGLGPIHQEDL